MPPIRLLIAVGLLMVFSGLISPKNSFAGQDECGKQFTSSEFQNQDIKRLIQDHKSDAPIDQTLAKKLADYGPEIVPYISQLNCQTKLYFFFLNPKGGIFGWYHDYAYTPLADEVINNISTPKAIPNLKKVVLESRIDGMAQDAIIRLSQISRDPADKAPIDKQLLEKIIAHDAINYLTMYNLARYVRLMDPLSPNDKTDVLLYLYENGRLDSYGSLDASGNLHNLSDLVYEEWKEIIRLLARTHTSKALSALERQSKNIVARAIGDLDVVRKDELLTLIHEQIEVAKGPVQEIPATRNWSLHLDLTIKPSGSFYKEDCTVQILVDGSDLKDIHGVSWGSKKFDVVENDGSNFRIRQTIIWDTPFPQSTRPIAFIHISQSRSGRTSERYIESEPLPDSVVDGSANQGR